MDAASAVTRPILVGAVAYDPKVVSIWEGFKTYFEKAAIELDYVLYSNYDSLVNALLHEHIDVAWNSPLAWVHAQLRSRQSCQALVMRDTDRDLTSKIIIRKGAGIRTPADLEGKTIAVGAIDSPQATLIPLEFLSKAGVVPGRNCRVVYHNVMVGKHGDHLGGEREAARALHAGAVDAACILDGNYTLFVNEGTLDPGSTEILASTPPYDHCNFTARNTLPSHVNESFSRTLLGMSLQDPVARPFMEMEGLTRWMPGRTSGYAQLEDAVRRGRMFDKAAALAS
ncbi:MAG TPA: phosphate/phosphite/phosphonate ABC transporter substrate-binding protein [Tepidisphaeraceae bacterium]|nr:phosphate/phosphite/phosphonate ABC transporter substrate-binding protein [Tepidisphaeraceae bacterium]